MRIRGTKPEFWRSHRIASVSWGARLVLKGLESYVDDNGVGKDDIELIIGDLFQRDAIREPSRTLARVSEAISELHQAGLVWRYEVDGTDLLFVSFWESFQRVDKPQSGRFPRPDGTLNYKDSEIRESLASPREPSRTFAPVTGEQGNRGTDKKTRPTASPKDYPDDFLEWWEVYPRREAKGDAAKAFVKAKKIKPVPELIEATKRWVAANSDREMKFVPLPASWLNGKRWDDEAPARNLKLISNSDPEKMLQDCWRTGDPSPVFSATQWTRPPLVWPEDSEMGPDFDKDAYRAQFWRAWLEENHSAILDRLRRTS